MLWHPHFTAASLNGSESWGLSDNNSSSHMFVRRVPAFPGPLTTTTWVNLENSLLSERRQSQRSHILRFHLGEMSRMGKSIEEVHGPVAARVSGYGLLWE